MLFAKRSCQTVFFLLALFLAALPAARSQDDFDNSLAQIESLLDRSASTDNAAESASLARQALILASGTKHKLLTIKSQMALAAAYQRLNEPDSAIVRYLDAAKLADKLANNRYFKSDIFGSIGEVFFREELYPNAVVWYDSLLSLEPDNLKIREKKGDALLLSGKITLAEQAYLPLIDKYSGDGDLAKVVDLYQKLADACNGIRDPQRGVDYYLLIQGIVERIGGAADRARLYNNLGYQYYLARDYVAARSSLEKAKTYCPNDNCQNPELHLINLGLVMHNAGESAAGIQHLLKARDLLLARKEKASLASLEHMIAKTYFGSNDVYNALNYNNLAIRHARESKQHDIWRNASKTAAELYLELYDHENAIDYYRVYLRLDDSLRRADQQRQITMLNRQALLERTEKNTQLLIRESTIKDLYEDRARQENANLMLARSRLSLIARQKEDSLILLQRQGQISESEARQRALELLQLNQKLQFEAKQRLADQEMTELRRREELDRAQQLAKDSIAARELRILQQNAAISQLELDKQQTALKYAYWLSALFALILGLLAVGWIIARRASRRLKEQNRRIEAQKTLIEAERAKSDGLLLNILPEEIAQELKTAGEATPRQYEQVTVVFTDFVNFSKLSENLSPGQLIAELDECFLAFDKISDKYGLEKIKTIGDAYMCAGGVPVPNGSNPFDAVRAAIEMRDWLSRRSKEKPSAVFREMRIGIHTGQVIAGVIGKNKFAYDIWGDAVNLAARLEEHGEAGKINISATTYNLIKEHFHCLPRGKKEVYNKGLVEMYFVEN